VSKDPAVSMTLKREAGIVTTNTFAADSTPRGGARTFFGRKTPALSCRIGSPPKWKVHSMESDAMIGESRGDCSKLRKKADKKIWGEKKG